MRWLIKASVFVLIAAALLAHLQTNVSAAKPPVITTLIEGRDAQQDRAVLMVVGYKVSKFTSFELSTMDGAFAGDIVRALKTKAMVVLTLPDTLAPAQYMLTLYYKGTPYAQTFYYTDGGAMPGRIGVESLNSGLLSELDDAETIDGCKLSQLRDASHLNAGNMSTERFSAFDDLQAEGKVGSGTASTLSLTDHGHADLAELDHQHPGLASVGHSHADLAKSDHGHADLATSTHGHADLAKAAHEHKLKWGGVSSKKFAHADGPWGHNTWGTADPGTVIVGIGRDNTNYYVYYRTLSIE